MGSNRHRLSALLVVVVAVLLLPVGVRAQRRGGAPGPNRPAAPLRFQFLGPASGGRIAAVVGIPGSPGTYYAGAASGGVWKSTDAGKTWAPIFDAEPAAAIGALAVAPGHPDIVWAGTGEAWAIRDADVMGDGIYKSTDGGATWQNMGLHETGRIGRIIVHPTDPDIVYVCALGRTTGPQAERGVFKTTDGGQHWDRVLFADPHTGCSGLTMDAHDPDVLFAGMWQVVMHTWAMFSGGPGSAIYVTRDGGRKWSKVKDRGLPKAPVGKIDVAIAPTDSKRVYALIQTADQGSLWRSDDGGKAWQVVSWDRTLIGRAGYYIRLGISSADENEVLVANSSLHKSTDGGLTFTNSRGCGDCHDIWIDPSNADHYAVTGDGGLSITTDHGKTLTSIALPIGQNYHVAVDDRMPYWVYSNRQDDGTMRGPSNAPELPTNVPSYLDTTRAGRGGRGGFGGGAPARSTWQHGIGGCESGFTIPVPHNPDVVWATCYGNKVTRYDDRTGEARSVSPWIHTLDAPPAATKYRCHWTPPLALDPFEKETVYYGCQVIFKTSNGGQSWTVISPDLSTQDPSRIVSSGGIIGDNLGQFAGEVVFAIAPSPIQRGLIWAGTNDGQIWYTRDGGGHWTNVTKNVTGMAPWGTIRQIDPSPFDPAAAYVAVDYHIMDNRDPFIYKTTDFGQTWTRISDGLPKGELSYVMSVVENPNRKGMLFAGTGDAFYYSLDDGGHWTHFQDGLPAAPVSWITVSKPYHDVVVSTYGRGLYVLRDLTRLEQTDELARAGTVFLFAPRPGFRLARSGSAELLYNLEAAPTDSVQIQVLDSQGAAIRTLAVQGRTGLSRFVWDLRYDAPQQVALRTLAPDNPHIWDEPRFKGHDTRPVIHWGIQAAQRAGPLAAPGRYSFRLTVNGQSYTRPFEVLKDETIAAPAADLAASTETQIRIRDDLDSTADMVNRIEIMRKQIQDQQTAQRGNRSVQKALHGLDQKMLGVELQLLSRSSQESDDKWFVEAYKVYLNLVWLNGQVGTGAGDVAGGADTRPTDAQLQVLQQIEQHLAEARADFQTLLEKDVPAFNHAMAGKVPPITDTLPTQQTTT